MTNRSSAPAPRSSPSPEKCPLCTTPAVEIVEECDIQWGGGREGEIGFVAKIVAPHWHCANCGEDWCDHLQSHRRQAALLRALYLDWQRLKKVASCGERGGGLEEAARECDKYAYEARGAATGLPSFPEVRERLWAKADAAEELARCIRALSSSPPSKPSSPSTE